MYDKLLVQKILEHPFEYDWSVQGLGMMRLYLSKEIRLHIWDSSLQVPNVSAMHTHPWDFYSYVVCGEIRNIRFIEQTEGGLNPHKKQEIFCGVGGGLVAEPTDVFLKAEWPEVYFEGDSYTQKADEIHISESAKGSITIIERKFKENEDIAYVYYKDEWVSAEPRPATREEVESVTQYSLKKWFNG